MQTPPLFEDGLRAVRAGPRADEPPVLHAVRVVRRQPPARIPGALRHLVRIDPVSLVRLDVQRVVYLRRPVRRVRPGQISGSNDVRGLCAWVWALKSFGRHPV